MKTLTIIVPILFLTILPFWGYLSSDASSLGDSEVERHLTTFLQNNWDIEIKRLGEQHGLYSFSASRYRKSRDFLKLEVKDGFLEVRTLQNQEVFASTLFSSIWPICYQGLVQRP